MKTKKIEIVMTILKDGIGRTLKRHLILTCGNKLNSFFVYAGIRKSKKHTEFNINTKSRYVLSSYQYQVW